MNFSITKNSIKNVLYLYGRYPSLLSLILNRYQSTPHPSLLKSYYIFANFFPFQNFKPQIPTPLTLFIGQSIKTLPCPIILKLFIFLYFPTHPENKPSAYELRPP
jgi:hypothetical protein